MSLGCVEDIYFGGETLLVVALVLNNVLTMSLVQNRLSARTKKMSICWLQKLNLQRTRDLVQLLATWETNPRPSRAR